jgi:DNA phosphorothioation-dependent restriction protein DptF
VYLRSKAIDQFILKFDLEIKDKYLEQFKIELEDYGIYALNSSCSYIRLSSLLGKSELGSDFRQSLNGIFQDREINEYAINWQLHKYFDGTASQKQTLNKFYRDILISSIHKYANRNASELAKDEYFLGEYNGFKIASELKIKPNFSAIEVNDVEKLGYFNAYLIVENHQISVIPISTNLLGLMLKINEGYRPNKHDKNTILLLDEVIEQIISIAKESNTLYIVNKNKRFKVVNEDHEYFEISGI